MDNSHHDALWRDFPKTLPEFEKRFPDEDTARAYFALLRWNGQPCCARCESTRVREIKSRARYDCADCGHQTSLTSGTVLEGTRKPIRLWLRAAFEMSVRRTGISAKDLQRIMGFGSYETAWTWLHKIRHGLAREKRATLDGELQIDECFIGGKGSEKAMVFVGAEMGGRIRMAHAPSKDEKTMKVFVDGNIAGTARITSDGLATYNAAVLGARAHEMVVQTPEERAEDDALQSCHWATSLGKRWLMGTHHGAVSKKHLQAYLDEHVFRYNRRATKGVARIAARAIEGLAISKPLTMRRLVDETKECRIFA
jgi:transposase-like protein